MVIAILPQKSLRRKLHLQTKNSCNLKPIKYSFLHLSENFPFSPPKKCDCVPVVFSLLPVYLIQSVSRQTPFPFPLPLPGIVAGHYPRAPGGGDGPDDDAPDVPGHAPSRPRYACPRRPTGAGWLIVFFPGHFCEPTELPWAAVSCVCICRVLFFLLPLLAFCRS